MLPIAMALSSFGGLAVHYALLVLWLTNKTRRKWKQPGIRHRIKARQLSMAAQLMEAQPTCGLGLGYQRHVGIPVVGQWTHTGLLFGHRGLGLLGRSGCVDYYIVFAHNIPAYKLCPS